MKIKIKFFAAYRDVVGRQEIIMDVEEGSKLRDVVEELKRIYPRLSGFSDSIIASVNKKYAAEEVLLNEGDEIALLPPVSGG